MKEKKNEGKQKLIVICLAVVVLAAACAVFYAVKSPLRGDSDPDMVACTIEIRCDAALDRKEIMENPGMKPYIPEDGIILPKTEVTVEKGKSVYDVLKKVTDEKEIPMESQFSSAFGTQYIQGINHLYEKTDGGYSGWSYTVNGEMPEYGCSEWTVQENDEILWEYTFSD